MTPEILYISKNAVVIYKPASIASQSDLSGDEDALTLTSVLLRKLGERDELYLINRLDRVVGGLLIFARNKKTAARLSDMLQTDKIKKEYIAVVEGDICDGELSDMLRKDSVRNKAAIVTPGTAGAKKAVLYAKVLADINHKSKKKSLVQIDLKTGRFHQIRAQLSGRGAPIVGDKKYGSKDFLARMPALFAYKLTVDLGDEYIEEKKLPNRDEYPWNLFSDEAYSKMMEEI